MDVNQTPPLRAGVLSDALELTTGDRNATYGDPLVNMQRTAELFNAFLDSKLRKNLNASDVAGLLALLKIARIAGDTPDPHRDSYVDGAAYLAIAYECAKRSHDATDGYKACPQNPVRKSNAYSELNPRYTSNPIIFCPDTEAVGHGASSFPDPESAPEDLHVYLDIKCSNAARFGEVGRYIKNYLADKGYPLRSTIKREYPQYRRENLDYWAFFATETLLPDSVFVDLWQSINTPGWCEKDRQSKLNLEFETYSHPVPEASKPEAEAKTFLYSFKIPAPLSQTDSNFSLVYGLICNIVTLNGFAIIKPPKKQAYPPNTTNLYTTYVVTFSTLTPLPQNLMDQIAAGLDKLSKEGATPAIVHPPISEQELPAG